MYYEIQQIKEVDSVWQSKEIFLDISNKQKFFKQIEKKKWGNEITRPDKTLLDAIKHIATYSECKTLEIGTVSGLFPRFACKYLHNPYSFLRGYWFTDPDPKTIEVLHRNMPEIPKRQFIAGVLDKVALRKFKRTNLMRL